MNPEPTRPGPRGLSSRSTLPPGTGFPGHTELSGRLVPLLLLALVSTATAAPVRAQAPERRVGGWLAPSLLVSDVAGRTSGFAGVEAGVAIGEYLRLGGGGFALLGSVELDRPGTTPLDLSLGYGGVAAQCLLASGRRWRLRVGVLAGGGAARVRDPVAGAELASDNFVLFEPRLEVGLPVRSFLEISLSARYRIPFDVDDLPGVSEDRIRGVGVALSVFVGSLERP